MRECAHLAELVQGGLQAVERLQCKLRAMWWEELPLWTWNLARTLIPPHYRLGGLQQELSPFFLIEVWLIYNIVSVSGVQQNDSELEYKYFRFFSIIDYYKILKTETEYSFLYYTVLSCSHSLSHSLSLRLYLQYMEVPRLGVESELQLPVHTTATAMTNPSHICNLYHSSWQHQMDPCPTERGQGSNLYPHGY